LDFNDYEECLQESRMREIRTSGLTRGSNGIGASRPLLSTLLVKSSLFVFQLKNPDSKVECEESAINA
jgi:hypothetical protein